MDEKYVVLEVEQYNLKVSEDEVFIFTKANEWKLIWNNKLIIALAKALARKELVH